jgi:hypothetical protein
LQIFYFLAHSPAKRKDFLSIAAKNLRILIGNSPEAHLISLRRSAVAAIFVCPWHTSCAK